MVFARTSDSHRNLCGQFESGSVKKQYLALVRGTFDYPLTTMLPISGKPDHGRYRLNFRSGKPAATSFYPVSYGKSATLVRAELHTGRTHQIRVHLKAFKHPLYQDFLYGEPCEDRRLSLFAAGLKFVHPVTGEPAVFEEPLSEFMVELCRETGII